MSTRLKKYLLNIMLLITVCTSASAIAQRKGGGGGGDLGNCVLRVCEDKQFCFWVCFSYQTCHDVRKVDCPDG